MISTINIHSVTSIESLDEVVYGADGTQYPLTVITVTTTGGTTISINLFDATEVSNENA